MKKYILFDLDGTLTDSQEGIINSVAYALKQFDIEVDDRNSLIPFIGPPLADSFQRFYGFDRQKALKAVDEYRVFFSDRGIFENRVYDGVEPMLAALKAEGCRLMVATSKAEPYAERILAHFGLDKYFDHICGTAMNEKLKQKDEVIAYALETAGVTDKSDAVMVGDRLHDIEGAKANGLTSIGVLYGYGSKEELTKAGADALAATPEELLKILKGEII